MELSSTDKRKDAEDIRINMRILLYRKRLIIKVSKLVTSMVDHPCKLQKQGMLYIEKRIFILF